MCVSCAGLFFERTVTEFSIKSYESSKIFKDKYHIFEIVFEKSELEYTSVDEILNVVVFSSSFWCISIRNDPVSCSRKLRLVPSIRS